MADKIKHTLIALTPEGSWLCLTPDALADDYGAIIRSASVPTERGGLYVVSWSEPDWEASIVRRVGDLPTLQWMERVERLERDDREARETLCRELDLGDPTKWGVAPLARCAARRIREVEEQYATLEGAVDEVAHDFLPPEPDDPAEASAGALRACVAHLRGEVVRERADIVAYLRQLGQARIAEALAASAPGKERHHYMIAHLLYEWADHIERGTHRPNPPESPDSSDRGECRGKGGDDGS